MNAEVTQKLRNAGISVNGVIMIGAHYAQELPYYRNEFGCKYYLMFEPNMETYGRLIDINTRYRSQDPSLKIKTVNSALGSDPNKKYIEFFLETANTGASCSVLKPKKHLDHYPQIQFTNKSVVAHTTMDQYYSKDVDDASKQEFQKTFNFIQLDVQGFELEVLKGAVNTLSHIDAILTEINRDELYEGCAQHQELTDFLAPLGFEPVYTNWVEADWGDCLYVKKKS